MMASPRFTQRLKYVLFSTIVLLSTILFAAPAPSFQKGLLFLKDGKVEQARLAFEDYIAERPSAQRTFEVAQALAQYHQLDRAVKYYEQVTKLLPTSSQAWVELALAQYENKKPDVAVETFKHAREVGKKDPRAYILSANILEHMNARYEARLVYQDMVKLGLALPFATSRLCHLFVTESFFDEAILNCGKAYEKDPTDMNSLVSLAKALLDKGEKQKGLFELARAIAKFKNEAMPYRERGIFYLAEGNHIFARKDLGVAVGLDPTDDESALNLGHAFFEAGLYDQALIAYTEAVHINGRNKNEVYRRARMLSIKRELGAYQKFSARLNSL